MKKVDLLDHRIVERMLHKDANYYDRVETTAGVQWFESDAEHPITERGFLAELEEEYKNSEQGYANHLCLPKGLLQA